MKQIPIQINPIQKNMTEKRLFIFNPSGYLSKQICQKALLNQYIAICVTEKWQASLYAKMQRPNFVLLMDTPENEPRETFSVFLKQAIYFYQTTFILATRDEKSTLPQTFAEKGLTIRHTIPLKQLEEKPNSLFSLLIHDQDIISLEDFNDALSGKQIHLYYQPKIHLKSKMLYGAEGLLRWEHPSKGLIMPNQILPLIERENLHETLTLYVIEKALEDIKYWSGLGIPMLKISVNVPALCMTHLPFYDKVFPLLEAYHDIVHHLIFEVTEQTAMSDLNPVKDYLQRLSQMGIELSIDDFGTGHSSLLRLMDLPFKEIKIEKAMVVKLPEDTKTKMILEVIFEIATKMKMTTCAEGIENTEQQKSLIEMGCTHGQGYLYSPALSPNSFLKWIADYQSKHKETK